MNIKNSDMRRKEIEHLCKRLGTDTEGLLRYHRNFLTGKLRGQCLLMYQEQHNKYFRVWSKEGKINEG